MTKQEFELALIGNGRNWTHDGSTRLRYIVADACSAYAAELKGRPDKQSRLRYAASQITSSRSLSKTVAYKLRKELSVVESRLVDHIPASSPPYR